MPRSSGMRDGWPDDRQRPNFEITWGCGTSESVVDLKDGAEEVRDAVPRPAASFGLHTS